MTLLAGDIGGTKTVLGLFRKDNGPHDPIKEEIFPSRKYSSLEQIVQEFLAGTGEPVRRASIGVAGPVEKGRSKITNLPWEIDSRALEQSCRLEQVFMLNDLEAIANAVPILTPEDLEVIIPGELDPRGTIGVLAPGTGLGEAFLTWAQSGYRAYPSEGGHVDFAPTNGQELGLLSYLFDRYQHVSYERVCSGLGIPNIYAYYRDSGYASEPAWLAQALQEAEDPTPLIVNAALDTENPVNLCIKTFDTFLSILGAEAGNLALKLYATGGIFLAGGIPPRIVSSLKGGPFFEAFFRKGRFADFVKRIRVSVILNRQAALIGAANFGFQTGEDPI